MADSALVARFRQFLMWLTVALCLGVIAELVLTDHMEEPLQWAPLIVCGLGAAAALAVIVRPNRTSLWALRVIMLIAMVSGVVGVIAHVTGNLEFAQEINAARANAAPLAAAFTGANPPLAPGALGATGLIALAATYWHPALRS
jgi:fatty acid desaturase